MSSDLLKAHSTAHGGGGASAGRQSQPQAASNPGADLPIVNPVAHAANDPISCPRLLHER